MPAAAIEVVITGDLDTITFQTFEGKACLLQLLTRCCHCPWAGPTQHVVSAFPHALARHQPGCVPWQCMRVFPAGHDEQAAHLRLLEAVGATV